MTCLSIHNHKIRLKILLFSKMTFMEIQRLNCTDSSQSMHFHHLFNIHWSKTDLVKNAVNLSKNHFQH